MAERLVERQKEPEPQELIYDQIYRWMENRVRKKRESTVIIHGRDLSWEQSRQGLLKYYIHQQAWDKLGIYNWMVFIHRIKRHSGKHTHKGGVIIFVLEGRGYTVVNGVKCEWEEGDLLLLPVNPAGNEHQHFNSDPDKPSTWAAFVWFPFYEAVGCYVQQKEASPDWAGSLLPEPAKPHVA